MPNIDKINVNGTTYDLADSIARTAAENAASAASGAASAARTAQQTANNAVSYAATQTISDDGKATARANIGAASAVDVDLATSKINDINDSFSDGSTLLSDALTDKTETVNGVTYTLTGNVLSVQGTATRNSIFNLYQKTAASSAWMVPGARYIVAISVSGNPGALRIDVKTGTATSFSIYKTYANSGLYMLDLPSDVTELRVVKLSINGDTYDGTITAEISRAITATEAVLYTQAQNLTDAQRKRALGNVVGWGLLPATATTLASITMPGCYNLQLSNYAALTDLPKNFQTNRVTLLINLQQSGDSIIQMLIDRTDGYAWMRYIVISTSEVGSWSEIHNSKYLSKVDANGDANNIAWNGWYGWGSTETVTHVPDGWVAGMLLNVVRAASTKYQVAFDYTTGRLCTRNLKNSVWSAWNRIATMDDISGPRTIAIQHETRASENVPEKVYVYIPASTGYIRYEFTHFIIPNKNCNCWRIVEVCAVNDNYANPSALTVPGEWECAIHLTGRDDFSGGSTHGDEMLQSIVFMVDGAPVTISDYATITPCNDLRIIRTTTMYDPADHTTAIADHGVEYVFTTDGLTINQSLNWLTANSLYRCYMCMFTPSKAKIDRAAANSDYEVLTLPSETGQALATITKANASAVTMWDTDTGWSANVSIPVYPTGLTGGDEMWLQDNGGGDYNKVYFVICTGGTSAVGELWKSKSIYKIGYKSVS